MPRPPHADPWHADGLRDLLHEAGFEHLRVRKRGAVLTIESGPKDHPVRHARLTRDTVNLWLLDFADHRGRWEETPYRDTIDNIAAFITESFPWTLEPRA